MNMGNRKLRVGLGIHERLWRVAWEKQAAAAGGKKQE